MNGNGWYDRVAKKHGTWFAVLIGVLVWLLPLGDGITVAQHKMLAITAGMVVAWITTSINFAVSAIALSALLYFVVGNPTGATKAGALIRTPSFAVSGFSNVGLWFMATSFVISISVMKTGLARRIALWLLSKLGGKPGGTVLATMAANLALAPLTPANTARAAAMLPIVEGINEAYGVKPGKSNFGKVITLATTFASNITASAFLTGAAPGPISIAIIAAAAGMSAKLSWGYWAALALPVNVIILLLTYVYLVRAFPFEKDLRVDPGYPRAELAKMGPLSAAEKKALLYFGLTVALWATDFLHHFNASMIGFVAAFVAMAPGIGVLDWRDFQEKMPWDLFVYFGGALTLADALNSSKAVDWLMQRLLTHLHLASLGFVGAVVLTMGFAIFAHVIFSTSTATAAVLMPVVVSFARTQGWDITSFALPMAFLMPYALFFPFNTMPNIIIYGAGHYTVAEQAKTAFPIGLMAWAVFIVAALTWWRWLGLF